MIVRVLVAAAAVALITYLGVELVTPDLSTLDVEPISLDVGSDDPDDAGDDDGDDDGDDRHDPDDDGDDRHDRDD